ncbi:L2 protein [Human papillomavirus type 72b]|uniref:Minor capsid protein L2 n=1 Tax=Human papillomavirus type 72b TaxID=1484958 RepID=A0A059U7K4_HPV72|nr:L2 protein [Human papillomavirus type 72b]
MAQSVKRRKRASATDLYRTCKQSGTCPPDVIPKVEGDTLADKILKWASLGVFFGGLGIGTGSGTGGRTGYVPIGTRPPTVVDIGPPTRPPVIIEPVGAADPSIVNLVEESSVVEAGATIPNFTGSDGFEITTSSTTTPAVLDITPAGTSVQVSSSSFTNPLFIEPSIIEPPQAGDLSGHVFTSTPTSGSHSFEEIPMHTFATHGGTGTEPISSTPLPGVRRLAQSRLGLYSKANQQVKVTDPAFLSRPSSLITYDNPVYDPEETIIFEHPSIYTPPDPDFLDIISLHRPALTARQGTVRVSRLGQRATLRTRSGKRIGARVHFYQDISPIPSDSIEMQSLAPSTQPNITYDIYADPDVWDPPPRASSSSISLHGPSLSAASTVSAKYDNVTVPLSTGPNIPASSGPDIDLSFAPAPVPTVPLVPSTHPHSIYVNGSDFYLLPAYIFFPKRRKRVPYSFADGFVAAW